MNVEAPADKYGFTIRPEMTDQEVIIRCLRNAPCGVSQKQADKIIKEIES